MASNAYRGIMFLNSLLKMLVLFILITNTVHFCQGKALLEETESNRGKRSYDLPNSGLHQTYDPQSNAEHWMKGEFYEPQVDGQAIYVPAVDQPGSYQEFLDTYYKAYAPAWNLETPAPYYDAKTTKKRISDKKYSSNYNLPVSKQSEFSIDMSKLDSDLQKSEDYDASEGVLKTIMTKLSKENPKTLDELEVSTESLKKHKLPETAPKDNKYSQPVVKTVKQASKINNAKDVHKNTDESVIISASDKDGVKYKFPISKESEFSVKMSTSGDSDFKSQDYDDPNASDKSIVAELGNEKSGISVFEDQEIFEEPVVVRENFKKSELTETKPKEHNRYDMPVVKTRKQKPESNNALKKSSTPKSIYESTEKTVITGISNEDGVKYASQIPEESEFSVEKLASDYDLEYGDSEDPEIIDKTVAAELNSEKSDMASELEQTFEEPLVHKSLKKSELIETKAKDHNLYDMPVVKKVNHKRKTNSKKKDNHKTSGAPKNIYNTQNSKTKGSGKNGVKYESSDYERKFSVEMNTSDYDLKSEDYENPQVVDKTIVTDMKSELANDEIEEPDLRESLESDLSRINKNDQYDMPVVVNTTQKSKTNAKKTTREKPNAQETMPQTDQSYEQQTQIVQTKPDKKQISTYSAQKYGDQASQGTIKKLKGKRKKKYSKSNFKTHEAVDQEIFNSNTTNEEPDEFNNTQIKTQGKKVAETKLTIDSGLNLENPNGDVLIKPEAIIPNANDFRGLSSMNTNIWSVLFNPNAEQNKLKLKRCITRSNETGFCTYIQNCEVPHIATSLEQLLNNACVIDDIFIGVCCPEFPVQTVKVQWDQTPSDLDNPIEDEFGHIAEDCGIRSNEASDLQSWPWKAPLVSMSNGKIFCGGVVVSEDHVLTAAHCTTKIPKNQILVRLGQYDDESGDDYAVVEIKRHAQYNPRTMQNDIALLKLGRRIMNDVHIGIVCLPDEEHQNNHDGAISTLLGWRGMFGTKSRDPEFLRVISNKECENRLGMKVSSTSLCTETRKESERTCNADSGAPLVIEDDGAYEVIGILSWNRNDCDQRFPSTFSRVSSYAGWIKNHIE